MNYLFRLGISFFFAAFCGLSGASAAGKTVNFASNTPTLSGTLPLIVAQEFGFFAAEGLDVKTILIRGGPTAMAALVGGGVDYAFVAGVAAVRAIAQNADRKSTRLNSSHLGISYAVFCLKK